MQLKYLLFAAVASAAAIGRRDLPAYEKTYGILNPAVHSLHQSVDEPPSYDQIREGGKEPRYACIEKRMQKVDIQCTREITRQPRKQQVKDIVIRTEAERQANHFTLTQQVPERRLIEGASFNPRYCVF